MFFNVRVPGHHLLKASTASAIAMTALAWVLGTFSAAAQTPSQVITLNDAITIALERNIDLQQAQVDAALSDVAVSEARQQFLPDLQLDAVGARNYGRNFNQTEGRILEQTTESIGLGASSGLTLFNGFGDLSALRQAKFARKAGHFDLERARQTILFEVASNFVALTQIQELLRVLRENLTDETRLQTQIQQYVEAGARSASDLYQQQANMAAARLAVVQAQNATESARVDLMQTLHLDPAGTYDFQVPDVTPDNLPVPPELAEWLEHARASRVDLKAEEARLAAAEQNVRVARAGFWPSLSLSAGYGSAYSSASKSSFDDQLDSQRGGSVGLGLSIPVFDRAVARNASRRAHLLFRRQSLVLESTREEIGIQVRRLHQDYQAAREQLSAAEAQQNAAERAVHTADERFKAGVAPLVELTQARILFLQAESALASARSNLLLQSTLMNYYLGDFDRAATALK
jgi:outer membrane protein